MSDFSFTTDEKTKMRDVQQGHMMDTCVIQAYTVVFDSYGQPSRTFVDGSAIKCGVDLRPGSERHTGNYTVVTYDATVRFPNGTDVKMQDRVKVTKRFGETLGTPLVFEVVGVVQRGVSGIRVLLSRVEL